MALTPTQEAQVLALIAQEAALLSLAANEAPIISNLGAADVSLSDLAAASSVDDADLLLIRQGTTDKSITGAIVKAAASIPDASTTVKGKVELATDAETQTGTDASRAITPSNLSSRTATETRTGIVELATDAEALAGTDTARAVTPAGIRAALSATGSAPVYACRAWVRSSGTGTTIGASGNVSSIARPSTGRIDVNFTVAMPDANYAYALTPKCLNALGAVDVIVGQHNSVAPTASACAFLVRGVSSFNGNDVEFSASFFR